VRRLVLLLLTVVGLLVPAGPVAAETTVTVKGAVINITMTVDVVGAADKHTTAPNGQPLVDYWNQVLQDTWGAAFNRLPYKGCFKLELKVKLKARDADFDAKEGNHRIIVGAASGGSFEGTGFEGSAETTRNSKTGDGTRSFEGDRFGAIPEDAPPTVVAHEFGHLFGLGDDRANGAPKNGRDGTMMVGGVPGVDVNVVPEIDKNLIDRLGNLIEKHLKNQGKKLPKCETAQMHLDSRVSGPGYLCTDSWEVTLAFRVEDREVAGAGIATGSGATCNFPIATPLTEASFEVTGRRAGNNLELSLRLSGYGDGVEWGAFPCTATGGDRTGPSFEIPASGAEVPVSFVGANCGSTTFEEFRADGTVRLTSADVA